MSGHDGPIGMLGDTEGWSSLDESVQKLWAVGGTVASIVYPLIGAGIDAIARVRLDWWPLPPWLLPAALFLFLLPFNLWMVGKRFQAWRYRLRPEDLSVAYGVFWKTRRYVNRARIQHVDVAAGPIARALGIVEVMVYVGGQLGPVVSIPGLRAAEAERLRQTLVRAEAPPVVGAADG